MRLIILVILACVSYRALPQDFNIVGNGGFEEYSSLPSHLGQINRAVGWNNLNGYYSVDNNCPFPIICAHPDYLHESSLMPSAEYSFPLVIGAYEGAGFSYLVTFAIGWEFYEYISSEFEASMIVGSNYNVEFMVARGHPTDSVMCWSESNNLGVLFSTVSPTQQESERVDWFPQFNISNIISHPEWRKYSFEFVADSAYRFVTFGNFFPRITTDTIAVNICEITGINSYKSSGYFIDNVSVVARDTSTSVSGVSAIVNEVRQNSEQLTVILGKYSGWTTVLLYDMAGKRLRSLRTEGEQRITINIGQLPMGIYTLCVESPNGQARRKVVIQ